MTMLLGLSRLISILFLCFAVGIIFDYKLEKTDNKNLRFKKHVSQIPKTFDGIGEIIVTGMMGISLMTVTIFIIYLICYILGGGIING